MKKGIISLAVALAVFFIMGTPFAGASSVPMPTNMVCYDRDGSVVT